MAYQQETTVAEHGAHVYKLDTFKAGKVVRSTLRELVREGEFLVWSPFGGWSVTLATGGARATAQAIAGCHARALALAPQAVAERRAVLEPCTCCRHWRDACASERKYGGAGECRDTTCEGCRGGED